MSEQKLRSGITTGTCAAAAAKAAILCHQGRRPDKVEVLSPQGRPILVTIASLMADPLGGQAAVIKDAGDDPDITNGVSIQARVEIVGSSIEIRAGEGVGTVTKPGLSVPVGSPAINPGPRKMIEQAVRDVLPAGQGAIVTISVPGGEALAQRTLNPVLGVAGGISIIGSTGIVEPMSEEAFKNSLTPQISVAKALGFRQLVLVPGKIGHDIAVEKAGLPPDAIVQTSNFIGHMLEQAVRYKIEKVLLFGHLGKIVKVAAGVFYTHNRIADARMETIAAHLAAMGAPAEIVREVLGCQVTEAALPIIEAGGFSQVFDVLAARASLRAERFVFQDLRVGTVIVTLKGDLLGMDETAREIGRELRWKVE